MNKVGDIVLIFWEGEFEGIGKLGIQIPHSRFDLRICSKNDDHNQIIDGLGINYNSKYIIDDLNPTGYFLHINKKQQQFWEKLIKDKYGNN